MPTRIEQYGPWVADGEAARLLAEEIAAKVFARIDGVNTVSSGVEVRDMEGEKLYRAVVIFWIG